MSSETPSAIVRQRGRGGASPSSTPPCREPRRGGDGAGPSWGCGQGGTRPRQANPPRMAPPRPPARGARSWRAASRQEAAGEAPRVSAGGGRGPGAPGRRAAQGAARWTASACPPWSRGEPRGQGVSESCANGLLGGERRTPMEPLPSGLQQGRRGERMRLDFNSPAPYVTFHGHATSPPCSLPRLPASRQDASVAYRGGGAASKQGRVELPGLKRELETIETCHEALSRRSLSVGEGLALSGDFPEAFRALFGSRQGSRPFLGRRAPERSPERPRGKLLQPCSHFRPQASDRGDFHPRGSAQRPWPGAAARRVQP